MMKNALKKSIVLASVFGVFGVFVAPKAFAGCTPNYGGGQTCIYNKNFDIDKKVRKEGDKDWKDKVIDVEKGEIVEFRIKVKNEGEVEVDDMKMKDSLPKEMERVGGSGLTEYWDNFEPDESKTFIIRAVVKDSEYDRKNFEKCVVNKAEVYYDGEDEASDTATVCYSDGELTELPKTGGNSIVTAVAGFGLMSLGVIMKKGKRYS